MRIDISEIRKQRNVPFSFHFCEQLKGELPEGMAYAGPADVRAVIVADSAGLTGEVDLQVPMRYRCSRCLCEFEQTLARRWEIKLCADEPEDEAELAEAWILIEDEQIDLRATAEEAIILTAPFRPLCSPDCRGICPGCGAELNREKCRCRGEDIDPRWEKLKDFKAQEGGYTGGRTQEKNV